MGRGGTYIVVEEHQPLGGLFIKRIHEWAVQHGRVVCSVLGADLLQQFLHEHRSPAVRRIGRDDLVKSGLTSLFVFDRHGEAAVDGCGYVLYPVGFI